MSRFWVVALTIGTAALLPNALCAQPQPGGGHPGGGHPAPAMHAPQTHAPAAMHAPSMHAPAAHPPTTHFHATAHRPVSHYATHHPVTHHVIHRHVTHHVTHRNMTRVVHHVTRITARHLAPRVAALRRNVVAAHRFHAGIYRAPPGYRYRRWSFGERLPAIYWGRDYWLTDFLAFGLFAPPPDYVWVRYGPDALLIDEYTGEIIQVDYGVFY